MSDILERLDDLRIFVRDNNYESKITKRAVVELYAGEMLEDLADAANEIESLRVVVDELEAQLEAFADSFVRDGR